MATFVPMKWGQTKDFQKENIVVLHCIEEEFSMRLQSFPMFGVRVRECHISYPGDCCSRFGALLVDEQGLWDASKTVHLDTPMVISVEESCYTEWADVKDADDAFSRPVPVNGSTIIYKWNVMSAFLPSATTANPTLNFVPQEMPRIDSGYCSHCDKDIGGTTSSTSPATTTLPTMTTTPTAAATSTTTTTSHITDSIIVKVAGSHKEARYQRILELVKEELVIRKQEVPLCLEFQPDNPMDVNAIVVKAKIRGSLEEVGTIPKRKIIKITKAMRNNEIQSIKFLKPPFNEVIKDGIAPVTLGCSIVIIKMNRWEEDSKYYSYNQNINNSL